MNDEGYSVYLTGSDDNNPLCAVNLRRYNERPLKGSQEYEDACSYDKVVILSSEVDQWLRTNLVGDYKIAFKDTPYTGELLQSIRIVFEFEEDALAFKLRWI